MKKFLLYCVAGYIALSVQSVFFKGIKPDFILVIVCAYALKYGHAKGVAFGAFSGLLLDTASGFILGPNMLSKSLAGFIARTVRENIFNWNITINTIVVALLTVIDIFIISICHKTFSGISFVNRPWKLSVMETFLTVAAALVMYVFLNPEKDRTNSI